MKQCKVCRENKNYSEFNKNKQTKDGLMTYCRSCFSKKKAEDYKKKWFLYQSRLKKSECKKKGIPFDLTPEYLESIWTEKCPVYGVPFVRFDKSHPNSPALDRTDPTKGYIKGNVAYISSRANRIKMDATDKELRLIASYVEGATTIPKGSTLK